MSVKTKIEKLQRYFKHQLRLASNTIFNAEVRAQRKNPNLIPIIIINFNQLFYLKQLIESLQKRDYNNIVVVDNLSTGSLSKLPAKKSNFQFIKADSNNRREMADIMLANNFDYVFH